MDELSTLVDVFCSSDEAWTEEDVAIFASTEEEEVAIVVESTVVSETFFSTEIFSVEEVDDVDVLMVFKDVRFTRDSEDDLVSFLEVATLVCLVSCLAELLADPDLARDVVFVIATLVFLELLPVAPTVLADAGGLIISWNLVCSPTHVQIY